VRDRSPAPWSLPPEPSCASRQPLSVALSGRSAPAHGAGEALILVATSGGPTMFARIGVMRALNRHVERGFNPSRKDPHWDRRKLAREKARR
jgi:hypothetical protein